MTDKQKLRIIRYINKFIDSMVNISMMLLLLIGCYFISDSLYVYYNARADKVKAFKPATISAETLGEISEDCVAWLMLEDTMIDFPVMQGSDNSEYLSKDPYGDYSLAGSIFLDSQNNKNFSEDYILIHGHHMAGAMFGHLDLYEKEEYFNNHLKGTITVGDKEYDYTIFAFGYTDAYEDTIYTPTENYPLNYIRNGALYFKEPQDQQIVLLSTCRQPNTTRRQYLAGTITLKETTEVLKNEKVN